MRQPLTKTSGQPFAIAELEAAIGKYFDDIEGNEGGEVGQRSNCRVRRR